MIVSDIIHEVNVDHYQLILSYIDYSYMAAIINIKQIIQ